MQENDVLEPTASAKRRGARIEVTFMIADGHVTRSVAQREKDKVDQIEREENERREREAAAAKAEAERKEAEFQAQRKEEEAREAERQRKRAAEEAAARITIHYALLGAPDTVSLEHIQVSRTATVDQLTAQIAESTGVRTSGTVVLVYRDQELQGGAGTTLAALDIGDNARVEYYIHNA